MAPAQSEIDSRNASFWDELCGTFLAQQVGVTDSSPESLRRYDRAYMDFYPYLEDYLPPAGSSGRALEIGLGYGTLGQALAERGVDYHGLDIAQGPVDMMRHRLTNAGIEDPDRRVQVGSALEIPHPDESFRWVYSIGCLHHTGDLPAAVRDVHRVLEPGGKAIVMLYNSHSFRRMVLATTNLPSLMRRGRGAHEESIRGTYDQNTDGEAAPVIDYTSKREAEALFSSFSSVQIRRENFDAVKRIPRERLLGRPAKLAGIDLYITAVK
jgi:ubiquinone/menaquinone biosynthesis C-methylase UbiE